MAIQFHCPGCSQPIEVDDIYAGRTAACPYCRRVVNVPSETTLEQGPPIAARPGAGTDDGARPGESAPGWSPAEAVPPPPVDHLHVGPTYTRRDRNAKTFGNYALICTGLSIVLFIGVFAYGLTKAMQLGLANPQSQPSQEQMAELEAELTANPWMGATHIGALFFACAGLALGITSLVQSRRNNWRGIVSVVVCALLMLCVCSAAALMVAGGGIGVPAAAL